MSEVLSRLEGWAPLLAAAASTAVLTPVAIRLARRLGAMDRPKADRWHGRETPLLGGVAVTAGLLVALLWFGGWRSETLAVAGGVLLLHLVGLVDDLKGVRPANKLVAQTAATGLLLHGGVRAGWPEDVLLSVPLTVLWVVGITNAVNLLDNMDGLASGIVAVSGVAVAACAALLPQGAFDLSVVVALAVAGAAVGFLPWNRHPARVFMGDSGSLPLGFGLAAAALLATHREAGNVAIVLAAPLLALAVPILDTTFVSLLRKWHGRSISQGGRDHLSHRLVALGIPERKAVRMLWLMSAVFGLFAVVATRLDWMGQWTLIGMALLAACLVGVVLGRVKVYQATDVPADAGRTEELRSTFLNYAQAAAPVAADFVLAGAAYICAYLLRYEGRIPAGERALLEDSILIVVAGQLAALAAYRVYRGVWRYFGTQDALALARGCGAAAVLTALLVVFGWRHAPYSRAVLVLDPALLVLFLFGSRSLARLLSDAFGSFPENGCRVLVVGAGEAGALCLRALRARGGPAVTPLGIVDDDPSLRRRHIHGIPVLGSTADLERLLAELHPEEVVLASLPDEERVESYRALVRVSGARLTLSPYAKAFVPL